MDKRMKDSIKRILDGLDDQKQKKSKFQKRLEEAMKASQEAKEKKERLSKIPKRRGGFQGFDYGGYNTTRGNYTSNPKELGSYLKETRRQLGGVSNELGKKLDRMIEENNAELKEPILYGDMMKGATGHTSHMDALEKWEHLEISEHAKMSIYRLGDKDCIHVTCTSFFKSSHRIFDFLVDHDQFAVKTVEKGWPKKTTRIASFKIMVDDFLNGKNKSKNEETKD